MNGPRILTPQLRRLIDFPMKVGESPTWDDRTGALWFVDILAPAAFRLDADGTVVRFPMPADIGCLGLCESGKVAVCLRNGVHLLDPASGALTLLCDPDDGRPDSRLNDGKVGPDGCLWVGTRDETTAQKGNGRLYRVKPDGTFTIVVEGLKTSNGLAWSPDGRIMYHSDSSQLFAQTFGFDPSAGIVSGPERLHDFDPDQGRPDGAAMDADGFYWVAGVQAGRINRLNPKGEIVEVYKVPVKAPTMPCFGGPDLATIYLTTLNADNNGIHEDGALFAFEVPGVRGAPVSRFAL